MSFRRAATGAARTLSNPRTWPTTRASPSAEEVRNGDPGPRTTAGFKKSQRKALRNETGRTQAVSGLDVLNGLLDPSTSPSQKEDRPRRFTDREHRRPSDTRGGGPRNFGPGRVASTQDAYGTSLRLKKITNTRNGPMSLADLDKAIKLVMEAPRSTVSTPVWNMLLGTIGREGRLELMWKTFNDMKKRGFKPTSRTYTTLLNAYAGLRYSGDTTERRGPRTPEPKTVSRVTILFDQAQSYLAAQMEELNRLETRNDPEELGLGTDAMLDDDESISGAGLDINVGPTNAYLKFLAKFGMLKEMEKVFTAMPTSGHLSPDAITYSTMFSALYDKLAKKSIDGEGQAGLKGLTPSALWSQAYRQFRTPESDRTVKNREIDEDLALIALKCLSKGDQIAQRQVMEVIDSLYTLPRPADNRTPSQIRLSEVTSPTPTGPRLPLTIRAATTIMSVCPKPSDRSHYAHLFLQKPELQKHIDTPFLITAIRAFSETGDVQTVLEIMDSYQPRQPNQWPVYVWHDALTAARWSMSEEQGMRNQPDFEAALSIFRRMTHLPPGAEDGQVIGEYIVKSPNGKPVDNMGVKWAKGAPMEVDAKAVSLLIKTALSRGWRDVQRAMAVFQYVEGEKLLETPASKAGGHAGSGRQWGVDLCRDVERACERLLERELPVSEKTKLERLVNIVKQPKAQEERTESRERRPYRPRQF